MRSDLTYLTLIVDRSGSMHSLVADAEGGINSLIESQQQEEGECRFTLVEFDNEFNVVQDNVDIQEARPYKLIPGGTTAYLDAVGRTVTSLSRFIDGLDEAERPGLVVVAIITDGYENASSEFNRTQIKDMITKYTNEYDWQFTFLGAGAEAFNQAEEIGIARDQAVAYSTDCLESTYSAVSNSVSRSRGMAAKGMVATLGYTAEERVAAAGGPTVDDYNQALGVSNADVQQVLADLNITTADFTTSGDDADSADI